MSIESDHINILIYRYLLESGFQHSGFTFAQEAGITKSSVYNQKIPPGSLIAHLQRGLNYVQAEINLTEDGRPADLEDLEAVEALTLLESVQPEVCEQRRKQLLERLKEQNKPYNEARENAIKESLEIKEEDAIVFKGHENVVFTCAWNPKENLLASGSSDSTARIWNVDDPSAAPIILRHSTGEGGKDVTSLHWSPDGQSLASGSYDGAARIWSKNGELKKRLKQHDGPLFSLKWSPSGEFLVTSSVDHTAIVWDLALGTVKQQFSFHSGPCVDVAWKDDEIFASCSTDKTVIICKVGNEEPLHRFTGHEDEVNSVKWHPSGKFVASCSDDTTARIWSLDIGDCVHTLRHDDKIYSLAWCSGRSHHTDLMLASASFDRTVKVWDGKTGNCIYTLAAHTMPVYSVAFSHSGHYLASGSFDNTLLIWSVETGQLLSSFTSTGGIFEVCWNKDDTQVAACYADRAVAVIKMK